MKLTRLLPFLWAIQTASTLLAGVTITLSPTEPNAMGTRNVVASVSATGSVAQSAIPSGVPLIRFPSLVGGTDNTPFSSNLGFGQSEGDFPFGESLQLADDVNLLQFQFRHPNAIDVRMQNQTGGTPDPIPFNTTSDSVLLSTLNYSDLSPGTYVSSGGGSTGAFGGFTLEIEALPLTLVLSPGEVVNGVTTTNAQFTQGNAAVPVSAFLEGNRFGPPGTFMDMLSFDGNPFDPTTAPDGRPGLGLGGIAGDLGSRFDLGPGLQIIQLQFDAIVGDGDGLLLRHVIGNGLDNPYRLSPSSTTVSLSNLPFDQLNPGTYRASGGQAAAVGGFELVIQPTAVPEPSSFLLVGLLFLARVGAVRYGRIESH